MELPRNSIDTIDDEILRYPREVSRPVLNAPKKASSPRVLQARASFVASLLYSLGLLALGGIITGIAYAMTSPGGTYVVTSGLFLIGGVYFCIAIWNMFKWLALMMSDK